MEIRKNLIKDRTKLGKFTNKEQVEKIFSRIIQKCTKKDREKIKFS
jgi:hypothetical protein